MRRASLAVGFAACLALPGPAFALFDDDVARAQILELRKQYEATARLFEDRLSKLEDRRALIELASQIEALKVELSRMRGQLEVLQNQIETGDKRGKDLYVDIDTRLRKLEGVKEAAEKAAAEGAPTPAEVKAYEAALNLFKSGNYPLAISAFQVFLVTYPASKLAPNAHYWMGNAQAAQGQHKLAIATQQKLIATWPDDAKAPDAMAGIASAQEALGDRRGAQKTLEGLLVKYPQSPAAASAKQRLQQGSKR
jgi:tol-pal system protein YbgF